MAVDRTRSQAMVGAKAESKPKVGKRVLDEVTVKPTKNGFIVTERHRNEGEDRFMSNHQPVEMVFESAEAASSHVAKCMGVTGEKKAPSVSTDKSSGVVTGKA